MEKNNVLNLIEQAGKACHEYACAQPVGDHRTEMFSIYSVLHNLPRRGYAEQVERVMNPLLQASPCVWSPDAESGWLTSCGAMFYFVEDGPKENQFKFCYNCGQHIEIGEPEEAEEDEDE